MSRRDALQSRTPQQLLTQFMAAKIDKQVFITQLIKAFENIGIKKRELRRHLAQLCEVSPSAVSAWLTETRANTPNVENLMTITEATGVSIDQLIYGENSRRSVGGMLSVINRTGNNGDSLVIPAMNNVIEGFAVVMDDDSMTAPQWPTFPPGTLVVFDARIKNPPEGGELVYARARVGDVMVDVFRRVIRVGGTVHLAALNPMYQPITDFEILGIYSYAVSGFNLTA